MINVYAGSVLAVLGTVDPQTVANTEKFTDVVDMSDTDQLLGVASLGDWANETIDFKAYSCDSDGSNAAALKAATQLAASATVNDNAQIVIAVKASELLASGKRHIKFGLVSGSTTGGLASVLVLGLALRYGLAGDQDLATVKQIKQ